MEGSELDRGVVRNIEGDLAFVEVSSRDACSDCGVKAFCTPGAEGLRTVQVYNPLYAKVGDQVVISEPEHLLLKVSAMQFGLPLLGFLAGTLITYFSGINFFGIPQEFSAFLIGLLGVLGGGILVRRWAAGKVTDRSSYLRISRIIK